MNDIGQFTNTSIGLLVVIGGFYAVARRIGSWLRARQPAEQLLTRHGTLALTPQCSIAVVRTTQEELVLGLTTHQVNLLTRTPLAPTAVPSPRTQRSVTHCKQKSRRIVNKPRRIFPQCHSFTLPKPS
jgi:flagellar biogenesis protein FliO